MTAGHDPRFSSRDLAAGRIPPLEVAGRTVPAALRVNTETLREHQARLRREGRQPLSRAEAEALFGAGQTDEEFPR